MDDDYDNYANTKVLEKACVGESTRADKCVYIVQKYKLKRNN